MSTKAAPPTFQQVLWHRVTFVRLACRLACFASVSQCLLRSAAVKGPAHCGREHHGIRSITHTGGRRPAAETPILARAIAGERAANASLGALNPADQQRTSRRFAGTVAPQLPPGFDWRPRAAPTPPTRCSNRPLSSASRDACHIPSAWACCSGTLHVACPIMYGSGARRPDAA